MGRFLLLVLMASLFSCSTKQETKDAAFWRMKYKALNSFVKRQGLQAEAERAVRKYEESLSKYYFTVFENHYSLNGKDLQKTQLKEDIAALAGDKDQVINISAMPEASHEDLLTLMNELSLAGFKNFNLSTQENIKPAP